MKKWNKRLILLLVLVLIMGISVGCGKTPKAPDNFDKDLWEGSIEVIDIIRRTYESDNNFSVEDEDKIEEYFDTYQGRQYNNNDEYGMIGLIQDLYKNYKDYLFHEKTYSDKSIAEKDKIEVDKILQEIQDKYELLKK